MEQLMGVLPYRAVGGLNEVIQVRAHSRARHTTPLNEPQLLLGVGAPFSMSLSC